MSAMKELYTEAVEEFHKWEDEKYGDKTPLADMHVDLWVEAYMLGYANGVKSQYLPKDEDPKARALNMVENSIVSADGMLINAFKYMSNDDVQNMLEFYYSEGKHENRRSA